MEAQTKNQDQRRLSDFLLESDEELLVETKTKSVNENKILAKSSSVQNSDPGSNLGLGKLIRSALFGRKSKRNKKEKEKKEKENTQEIYQKNFASSSEKTGNDISELSVGMGIGLFLLLAKSNYEYNKMSELHTQMKALLEEIKLEFENKLIFSSSNSSDLCCNSSEFHEENKRIINCDKMERMGAELEIEFERLRFDFGEEQNNEMPEEWIDFCENLGANLEKDDENGEEELDQDYQVCPYELERKLQHLMNQRQEERIKELESQLRNLERKLLEKDTR